MIAALSSFCALGCAKDEAPAAGTVVVTFGKEVDEWPQITSLVVKAGDGATSSVAYEGSIEGASIGLGQIAPTAKIAFSAEARDTSGNVVARGQTPFFAGADLEGETVPILLSPLGRSTRPNEGLVGSWDATSSAVLLGGRYALFARPTATTAEIYDVGLLFPSVGGPTWPRPPKTLLRATTREVLVLDENGGSLADVFSTAAPTSVPLAAADAAGLVGGQTLDAGAATDGQWLAGPCRSNATLGPSDRVLFLDPDDHPTVTKLSTTRVGAACVVSADGSLVIAGGGVAILTVITKAGAVSEVPFADDRRFGAATWTSDGAVLLVGGTTTAGTPAPTWRLPLPCGETCEGSAVTMTTEPPLGSLRAYPSSTGRAFYAGGDETSTRVFFGASTSATTTFVELPLRLPRSAPQMFPLIGERLLIAGGTDLAGAPITDVEIVTAP